MKKVIVLCLILISFFVFSPAYVCALTLNENTNFINNNINILDENEDSSTIEELFDEYDKADNCKNDILGDPSDPNSVAWLLQKVLDIARIAACLIVIVLSSIDFSKVIVNSDDDSMKKATKKLTTRVILIIALFLIPTLITVFLSIFGITSDPTCGLR